MEVFNSIWNILISQNYILANFIVCLFLFIQIPISLKFFILILNIHINSKQKVLYYVFTFILCALSSYLIPNPFSIILIILIFPFMFKHVLKVNFLQAISAEFVPAIFAVIFEICITRLSLIYFDCDYCCCLSIPFNRIVLSLLFSLFLFILYILVKHYNFNISNLNTISAKNKQILVINCILAFTILFLQIILVNIYNEIIPFSIILLNVLCFIVYSCFTIFGMIKAMYLEKATEYLAQEKAYNKTLQSTQDNVKALKHDFSNIVSGIMGYLEVDDFDGLREYCKHFSRDFNHVKNLSTLSPELINNPAIYSILSNKYYKATDLNIHINLEYFFDFNTLNMPIYEFARIFGILMDNAIEATSECSDRIINIIIRNDLNPKRQLLIIENTYKDKNIDINKIYLKGFSTKKNNTGLGLWEIDRILSKHTNITRFTSKNSTFFKQQLEIYPE